MKTREYTILYVDDEQMNLEIFKLAFKRQFQVITSYCPIEALEILRKNTNIQIIISDYKMPEMLGTDFLYQAFQISPNSIRIILTAYHHIESVRETFSQTGIYKFITKPWEKTDMEMTLQKAIETYELRKENFQLIKELVTNNKLLEEKVNQKTEEIKQYNELLRKKNETLRRLNKKTNIGMTHASAIQKSFLGKEKKIQEKFRDYFVLEVPLEILSGDFYWFHQSNQQTTYLAVVDCAGYGVSGSLMSIIGYNALNEVMKNLPNSPEPSEILEHLYLYAQKRFDDWEEKDKIHIRMDIGLCKITYLENAKVHISFSGAIRPLYILQEQELDYIKGSRIKIGETSFAEKYSDFHFENHTRVVAVGTKLYLFTNGWTDQINGDNTKYGYERSQEIIRQTSSSTLQDQMLQIMQDIAIFKGKTYQLDDILVIGIEV